MQSSQQTCQIRIQVDVRINKVKGNRGVYNVQRLGNRGVYSVRATEACTALVQQRRIQHWGN